MARRRRTALSDLSGEHLDIQQIDGRRRAVEAAIEAYYANSGQRFLGYAQSAVLAEKNALLDELRRSTSMDVFGALEAAFQIDFLQRCHDREEDDVSRAFKKLYRNNRRPYVRLSAILVAWRENSSVPRQVVIKKLMDAFEYRNWLAHGRYLNPERRLNYDDVYLLAEATLAVFPLKGR